MVPVGLLVRARINFVRIVGILNMQLVWCDSHDWTFRKTMSTRAPNSETEFPRAKHTIFLVHLDNLRFELAASEDAMVEFNLECQRG
jgi:hypothetical protein